MAALFLTDQVVQFLKGEQHRHAKHWGEERTYETETMTCTV
jgi:hypothetical protein